MNEKIFRKGFVLVILALLVGASLATLGSGISINENVETTHNKINTIAPQANEYLILDSASRKRANRINRNPVIIKPCQRE